MAGVRLQGNEIRPGAVCLRVSSLHTASTCETARAMTLVAIATMDFKRVPKRKSIESHYRAWIPAKPSSCSVVFE